MERLTPPPPLVLSGNLAENWRKFRQRFKLFMTATAKDGSSDKVKSSILLSTVGEDALELYNTFHFVDEENSMKLKPILDKFEAYCVPKRNITYERHRFFTCSQREGERIDQYVTELKNRAKTCEFELLNDSLIRDRIVCGIQSNALRERLLREQDLSLERAVAMCRAAESSKIQIQELHADSNLPVHTVRQHGKQESKGNSSRPVQKGNTDSLCNNCGYQHASKSCPAYGKRCHNCGKSNHYARKCRSPPVPKNQVHMVEEVEEELFVDSVGSSVSSSKDWIVSLSVQGTFLPLKLDSGSQANILSEKAYNQIVNKPQLYPTRTKLTGYLDHNIPVIGQCTTTVKHKSCELQVTFVITPHDNQSLLGLKACEDLGLVKRVLTVESHMTDKDSIFQNYADVFQGLGCLPGEHHIMIDPEVPPVAQACRRVPFAQHDRLKDELVRMEKLDVITKVEEATDWVSPLVIVEKPNKQLRVCLDPKHLNQAIKRERFMLPTRDEIMSKFANAKYFSKLDASSGFWQLRLDEESSKLCTFITPFGRYRFLRLPFGISSAPEVYHKTVHAMFDSLAYVDTSMDDIIIAGATLEEHDNNLTKVLDIARKYNLKLNPDKCVFRQTELTFLGEVIGSDGIKPDGRKVEAIRSMQQPTSKKDVQRFLGMVNYLGKFVPNLSEKSQPLRELLDKNVEFQWTDRQDQAWSTLKEAVSQEPVLKFFDPKRQIKISSDASQNGLGAVLLQQHGEDWLPVVYASRALNSAETRYAQIEKEMLSITFACERFHQYVYGQVITVETDHKPLVSIFRKSMNECPLRIQRLMLRMQKYDVRVVYIPGKFMFTADTLSRSCRPSNAAADSSSDECVQAYVDMVVSSLPVSQQRYDEIRRETNKDKTLQVLKVAIQSGWPEYKHACPREICEYFNVRAELNVIDDVIFKGDRIVIPRSLRRHMLEKIHAGHLGMDKCKRRARDLLYWPGMNRDISDLVFDCLLCQTYKHRQQSLPLQPHQVTSRPWEKVAADLFHCKGKDYLVIMDYHSNYPEVCSLTTTTSRAVILSLKTVFARHGVPDELFSDNGPQFRSHEFVEFAKDWDFVHTTSSPNYPQSNGLAEKGVQIVKNILLKESDPHMGLLVYRTTPLDSGQSPSQILMGRRLRANLPVKQKLLNVPGSRKLIEHKRSRKQKQKQYYDRTARSLPLLQCGSRVAVRDVQRRDWSTRGTVLREVAPRSYNVRTDNGGELRRNRRDLLLTSRNVPGVSVPSSIVPASVSASIVPTSVVPTSSAEMSTSASRVVTRSGRVSTPPSRFGIDS